MNSVLTALPQVVLDSIILVAFGSGVFVLLFMAGRFVIRKRRARRFDDLSLKIHQQWRDIVRGDIPPEEWRGDPIQCEIVQSIVIQEIGAATDKDRAGLQEFLRSTGLIEICIRVVHEGHGWRRRRAMLALGAMRVPEAITPLVEALDDWQLITRMTAVQSLGLTGLAEAGEPIIECFMVGGLNVPREPVANALVRCFADHREAILPYLRRSVAESRELLARVASELATPAMADEMILCAADSWPEVRAAAAKALAVAPLQLAIPALGGLARDDFWFVRLRAVAALNQIAHPRSIPVLLEAVRDTNRVVRTRAAAALAKFEQETVEILQNVADSHDRYALLAMINALELGGGLAKVMTELADPLLHDEAASRLLAALREGAAGIWTKRPTDPVVESVFP